VKKISGRGRGRGKGVSWTISGPNSLAQIPRAHESGDGNAQSQTTNTSSEKKKLDVSKTAGRMQCSSIVAEMEKLQEEVALKRQQLREEETKVEAILQNLNQQRLLNSRLLRQHSTNQHLLDLLIAHFLAKDVEATLANYATVLGPASKPDDEAIRCPISRKRVLVSVMSGDVAEKRVPEE
ncbi:hypothetical protein Goari_023448, partial [Gossypium aridum]|nr:hypothetical protein [Gossypium aridum]